MIFGRFTQVDASVTRKYGGTGLGLAIAKGLVERMGGQISATSEMGKGSTFSFTIKLGLVQPALPELMCHEKTGASTETAGATGPADQTKRVTNILIVEDSEDNLFLIEAYLSDTGFQLDVADNGEEAVGKVSGNYDLVLMDVQMPVMDGHTATRLIRQREAEGRLPPVPILALTADAFKEQVDMSMQAGCSGPLPKPISQAILLAAVARYAKR